MPWVRFDDQYAIHRKVDGLSDAAFRLHTSAIFWCARNLTDGFVSDGDLDGVTARVRTPARFAAECVNRGAWHEARFDCPSEKCAAPVDGDGWVIHDYLEYQPSKDQVAVERKKNSRRQALFRNPALRQLIRDRDGDACRYCGRKVRWGGGQSATSGCFDHVDPDGPNTAGNLVVACFSCNSRKMDRTPGQAGMQLRQPPPRVEASTEALGEGSVTRPRPGPAGLGSSKNKEPNPSANGRPAPRASPPGSPAGLEDHSPALPRRSSTPGGMAAAVAAAREAMAAKRAPP